MKAFSIVIFSVLVLMSCGSSQNENKETKPTNKTNQTTTKPITPKEVNTEPLPAPVIGAKRVNAQKYVGIPESILTDAGDYYFKVDLEQDGKLLTIKDDEVEIAKKPFSLIFTFKKSTADLLVNASYDQKSYDALGEGKPRTQIEGFKAKILEEVLFNADFDALLSPLQPCYWMFSSPESHRFNSVKGLDDRIIGKRTIVNLFELSMEKINLNKNTPVENIEKEAVYFTFLKLKGGSELQRGRLKIKFK